MSWVSVEVVIGVLRMPPFNYAGFITFLAIKSSMLSKNAAGS
jgi:hypothetical protein